MAEDATVTTTTPLPNISSAPMDATELARLWRGKGSPLHLRRWIPTTTTTTTQDDLSQPPAPSSSDALSFSVMTWNILANMYAKEHSFYCPEASLTWEHRFPLLAGCIADLHPDILTLQEVDGVPWASLNAFLVGAGYDVVHHKKAFKANADGLVIALKRHVFDIVQEALKTTPLVRTDPQVGLAVLVRHRPSQRTVIIATTHLKAPPNMETLRRRQMSSFLKALHEAFPEQMELRPATSIVVDDCHRRGRRGGGGNVSDDAESQGVVQRQHAGLIITGDFNTAPTWKVLQDMKRKRHFHEVYTDADPNVAFGGGGGGGVGVDDAEESSGQKAPRRYTICMPWCQDQMDYIFYAPSTSSSSSSGRGAGGAVVMQATELLAVPCFHEVAALHHRDVDPPSKEFPMLPTPSYPSDHLHICARFCI